MTVPALVWTTAPPSSSSRGWKANEYLMGSVPLRRRAKQLLKTTVTAIGKHVPMVHESARRLITARRAREYRALCASTAVEPGVAIFESYSGRGYSCSPRAISEAMRVNERTAGYELVWVLSRRIAKAFDERGGFDVHGIEPGYIRSEIDLDREFGPETLEILRHVRIVSRGSEEYYRDYARAELWVTNCRIPAHLMPREGQTLIQAWHGTPLKRLGFDIQQGIEANAIYSLSEWQDHYGLEGRRLTYLLAASPFAAKALASAFNLVATGRTSTVLELGYPRNDYLATFTAEQAAAVRRRLGIPDGNRVVLYAPTWRDDQHSSGTGYTYDMEIDFDRLRQQLGEGYTILFRAHYLIANEFDFGRFGEFVIDASQINDINDLYIISDVLVTDYSSVFFDYANLQRPMIFYMYDLDRYANEVRGFYLSLDELPGPIVQTQDELAAAIERARTRSPEDIARLKAFAETYAPLDDGHASERVIERAVAPLVYDGVAPEAELKEAIPE